MDILINNAGISAGELGGGKASTTSQEELHDVCDTNFVAPVALTQALLPQVNSAHPSWVKTDMGTDAAPMEIPEGGKTGVALALLAEDGPAGAFIHLGKPLPW